METQVKPSAKRAEMRDDGKKIHTSETAAQHRSDEQRKRQTEVQQKSTKKSKVCEQVQDLQQAEELMTEAEIQLRDLEEKIESSSRETVKLYHSMGDFICDMVAFDNELSARKAELKEEARIIPKEDFEEEFAELETIVEQAIDEDKLHYQFLESIDEAIRLVELKNLPDLEDHLSIMEQFLKNMAHS